MTVPGYTASSVLVGYLSAVSDGRDEAELIAQPAGFEVWNNIQQQIEPDVWTPPIDSDVRAGHLCHASFS